MNIADVINQARAFYADGQILTCQAPLEKLIGGSISSALNSSLHPDFDPASRHFKDNFNI